MTIQDNVIGWCATTPPGKSEIDFDLGAFLRRLLQFDVYFMKSIRLREIPHIVQAFGYEGTLTLLGSGALRVICSLLTIGEIGQTVLARNPDLPILPTGSFRFSTVREADHEEHLGNCLQNVHGAPQTTLKQQIKLARRIS